MVLLFGTAAAALVARQRWGRSRRRPA
ncbi:hypothetical protein [Novosphingobium sp. SG919]|nr:MULTISPECIES: hypothetical protein [unclassified Novosphingobium]